MPDGFTLGYTASASETGAGFDSVTDLEDRQIKQTVQVKMK